MSNYTELSKIDKLHKIRDEINEVTKEMERNVKHENVAIFIGNTRSGKSTLVNYCIGNELIGFKKDKFSAINIKQMDSNTIGPEIGIDLTSKTNSPSRWTSIYLHDLIIWDMPGFADNRSEMQDIINAFYVKELLKNVKSAIIVMVCDINDLFTANIHAFLSLLRSTESLFGNKFKDCLANIAIIFTKVPEKFNDNGPVNKQYICDFIQYKIINSDIDMNENIKFFLNFIVNNIQCIGLFKRATLGPLTKPNIDVDICEAIQSRDFIRREIATNCLPSVSPETKIFLYETRNELIKDIEEKLEESKDGITGKLEDIYMAYVYGSQMTEYLESKLLNKLKLVQANGHKLIYYNILYEKFKKNDGGYGDYYHVHTEYIFLKAMQTLEYSDQLLNLSECHIYYAKFSKMINETAIEYSEMQPIKYKKMQERHEKNLQNISTQIAEIKHKRQSEDSCTFL